VPWIAVRRLRLLRAGDPGGLSTNGQSDDQPSGLRAPDGRTYRERDMRLRWQTCEQASLFRQAYDRQAR